MRIIDAHHHFWRIDREDYTWMDDTIAAIRRDFLPAEFAAIRARLGIVGSVVVQAAPTVAETEFLLDLAGADPSILGVVGWVDLEAADVAQTLRRMCAMGPLKAVRPMLQDINDTEWILRPHVLRGLRAVVEAGLRMDALITPRHMSAIDALATEIPALRIVVDHCAKPDFSERLAMDHSWKDGMSRLANHSQISCKLSGLATEYGAGWSAEGFAPVSDHVLAAFGPERLMWGSDWPVLCLAGRFDDWLSVAQTLTASLTDEARAAVFGQTATGFYGLGT